MELSSQDDSGWKQSAVIAFEQIEMEWNPRSRVSAKPTGPGLSSRRLAAGWWMALLALNTVWLAWPTSARAALIPEYSLEDTARFEVTAPAPMSVLDPVRTRELQEQKAARVPPIYRFHSGLAEEAELAMREEFERMRESFLSSMNTAAQRPKLNPETVEHPSFHAFVEWFRRRHAAFPLSGNLARAWALHEPDADILEDWARRLRDAMNQCVQGDFAPRTMEIGPAGARIVPVNAADEVLGWAAVENRGVIMNPSKVPTLSAAQAGLRQADLEAEPTDRAGHYLAGFLRVNCFPEEELTEQARQRETKGLQVVDHYATGDRIVAKGAAIDSRAKAALDLLRLDQEAILAAHARRQAPPGIWTGLNARWPRWFANPLDLELQARRGLAWLAGLSLVAAGWLAYLVRRKRSRPRVELPPGLDDSAFTVMMHPLRHASVFLADKPETSSTANIGGSDESEGQTEPEAGALDRFWRQRAWEAERRAEEIMSMVRAGLAPQLAKRMMNRLVQELISQRAQWLQTQQVAEQDLTELERRIALSNSQMQERLRAFEKRTAELEQALALKAQETAELLKSHIALTQKQLAHHAGAKELIWN